MALDPNIILQAKAVQLDNPLNALAQYSQIQNAQNQNALSQYTIGKAKRDDERANAVQNALVSAGGDAQAGYQALAKQGYLKEALDLQKSQLDQDKTRSEVDKNRASTATSSYDLQLKKTETIGQTLGALLKTPGVGPQQISQSLQQLAGSGIITPEQAQQAIQGIPQDPAQIPAYLQQHQMAAMKTADQLKYTMPDANAQLSARTSMANTAANNATSMATNANTVSATLRGQDKGQIVQSDSGPVLVDPRTGSGQVVTGADGKALPGVSKPLNDSQSKALLFGTRMQEANKVLAQLQGEGTTTSVPGSRMAGIGPVINAFSPENKQMLDQGKRDFMTALLRRESGAAISNGEFDTADKQYFPQPGDSDKVIAQKARNRELAINGVLVEVPEKQRASITPKSAGTPAQQVQAAVNNGESARIGRAKPPSVSSTADYNRLPSGTVYMAPDGSMRTKQ